MKHRLARQADQDLIDVYLTGVRTFGSMQAERYHTGLIAHFDLLATHPEIAHEREELRPPMRLHPYRASLVAYVVRDTTC